MDTLLSSSSCPLSADRNRGGAAEEEEASVCFIFVLLEYWYFLRLHWDWSTLSLCWRLMRCRWEGTFGIEENIWRIEVARKRWRRCLILTRRRCTIIHSRIPTRCHLIYPPDILSGRMWGRCQMSTPYRFSCYPSLDVVARFRRHHHAAAQERPAS